MVISFISERYDKERHTGEESGVLLKNLMKAGLKKITALEKVDRFSVMVTFTKETPKTTGVMDTVRRNGHLDIAMQVNGKTTCHTVKAHFLSQMVTFTLETLSKTIKQE